MTKQFIAGLDIGYSNTKIAFGYSGQSQPAKVCTWPSNGTRRERSRFSLNVTDSSETVEVSGVSWRVFENEPDEREINSHFHQSDLYMALYLGAIKRAAAEAETDTIDVLVTGLPAMYAISKKEVDELSKKLTGTFPADGKNLTVRKVIVSVQGVGVINDIINCKGEGTLSMNDVLRSNLLVIDPGFFSMDYVVFRRGERMEPCSGSSLHATGVLIDTMVRKLTRDNSRRDHRELRSLIEHAFREGKTTFHDGFHETDLTGLTEECAKEVAANVVSEISDSTRLVTINVIAGAGGGIRFYEKAFREFFPDCKFIVSDDPVTSNARGFWHIAAKVAEEE